jgi:hypothetical protein
MRCEKGITPIPIPRAYTLLGQLYFLVLTRKNAVSGDEIENYEITKFFLF